MIDQERYQKGRGWAYVVGLIAFVVVAVWKFATR
jgi:hypothetical protein